MILEYCPSCGSGLIRIDETKYVCKNGHSYWNSPQAAVGVVIIKGNKILFSKRKNDPKKHKYDFPGGFLKYNEQAEEAAIREVGEETGIVLQDIRCIGTAHHEYEENRSVCDIVLATKSWEGTPKANDDVAELEWKPIDFIDSEDFAWGYHGIADKIKEFIKSHE